MKHAAGIVWYNDNLIFRCLDSIHSYFDHIFVIDGKYLLNPVEQEYSNPELVEKVKQYPNVIYVKAPIVHEERKREEYLRLCKEYGCDALLIIDSDEYADPKSTWDIFWQKVDVLDEGIYGVYFHEMLGFFPRLWIKPYNYKYYEAHCIFQHIPTGKLIKSGPVKAHINGIKLHTDDAGRDPEYLKNTLEYQKRMIEKEKPVRRSIC